MNKRQKKKQRNRYIKEISCYKINDSIKTVVIVRDSFKPRRCNILEYKEFGEFPPFGSHKMRGIVKFKNYLSKVLVRKFIHDQISNFNKITYDPFTTRHPVLIVHF